MRKLLLVTLFPILPLLISACKIEYRGEVGLARAERIVGFRPVLPCYLPDDLRVQPGIRPDDAYRDSVTVIYATEAKEIRYDQWHESDELPPVRADREDKERTEIDGVPAIVSSSSPSSAYVNWAKDGYEFTFLAVGYSKEEALRVVRSMITGCGDGK